MEAALLSLILSNCAQLGTVTKDSSECTSYTQYPCSLIEFTDSKMFKYFCKGMIKYFFFLYMKWKYFSYIFMDSFSKIQMNC